MVPVTTLGVVGNRMVLAATMALAAIQDAHATQMVQADLTVFKSR
jgi:hypothetical protein